MPEPVRTCIGCRQRAPKATLVRVVWDAATAGPRLDPNQVLPGRGAYLHPGCTDRVRRNRGLGRQLRVAIEPAQAEVVLAEVSSCELA